MKTEIKERIEQDVPKAKVGMKVLILYRGMIAFISKITGETKTCWRVDDELYRKKDLHDRTSVDYVDNRIQIPSEEELKDAEALLHHRKLVSIAHHLNYDNMTDKQLEQIIKWGSWDKKRIRNF